VLAEALDTPSRVTDAICPHAARCFSLPRDDVFKPVNVLSGGEKSRLALVKLLLDPPNLVLMDEPTTHLDLASIDALIYALQEFTGTLIFISHDVYFIRALANRVLHVNAGVLTNYPGDYQYYLDKTKALSARLGLTAGERPAVSDGRSDEREESGVSRKEQKRLEAEQRQARLARKEGRAKARDELEQQIAAAEARQAGIDAGVGESGDLREGGRRSTSTRADGGGRELQRLQTNGRPRRPNCRLETATNNERESGSPRPGQVTRSAASRAARVTLPFFVNPGSVNARRVLNWPAPRCGGVDDLELLGVHRRLGAEEILPKNFFSISMMIFCPPCGSGHRPTDAPRCAAGSRSPPAPAFENFGELALDLHAHRFRALDAAASVAIRAVVIHGGVDALAVALTGHLHQASGVIGRMCVLARSRRRPSLTLL